MTSIKRNSQLVLWLIIAFSVIAAVTVFLASPTGEAIVTPDALQYISAARSVAQGGDYLRFEGAPLTEWPPLYPTLLVPLTTISEAVNLNLLDVIRLVNAATAALTVFAGGLFLLRHLSPAFALLGTAAILLSRPYLITYPHVMSEPLSGLLTILLALQLARVLRQPGWRAMALLTVIAALGALQRYMGLAFIPGAALCLLLFMRDTSIRRRLTYAISFGVAATLPLALWLLRNYQLAGYWIRPVSFSLPRDNPQRGILYVPTWIGQAFVPEATASAVNPVLGLVLLLGIVLAACFVLSRRVGGDRAIVTPTPVAPIVVVTIVYVAVLLVFTSRTGFGALETRFLSVIYVFVIAMLLSLVERFTGWLGKRLGQPRVALGIGLAVAVLAVGVYPVHLFAQEMQHLARWCCKVGEGHELPLVQWLNENPVDGRRYSNLPVTLYYSAGYTQQVPPDVAAWPEIAAQPGPAYLIWFADEAAESCSPTRYCQEADYTLEDVAQLVQLEPLVALDDGAVYRIVGPDANES